MQDISTPAHAATPYFRPRRLGHVNLIVEDTDASMRFYQDVAGFEEVYRVPAIGGGFLSNGNTHHDVGMVQRCGPSGKGRPPGLNHLAFELETEVALVEGYERSLRDGCAYERTLDHDIAHSAYCADPDGNSCELYADVVREWRSARNGQVTKPKPAWWPGLTPPNPEHNYHVDPEIRVVPHAAFHPQRTQHATLVVASLDDSIAFYRQRIGLTLLARGQNYALMGGSCGQRHIALVQADAANAPGYHHVGFEMASPEALMACAQQWQAQGGRIERQIDHPLRLSVFILDPDGLRLQFFADRVHDHAPWEQLPASQALWVV
ncbi:VOC family protein [Bordetella trematum]|uniref:VOC family protein n=3 Tax=Bordetella trematum TaxID=123899 RepID=UPI00126A7832|nr:VOC family protein [Bordetella trematum]